MTEPFNVYMSKLIEALRLSDSSRQANWLQTEDGKLSYSDLADELEEHMKKVQPMVVLKGPVQIEFLGVDPKLGTAFLEIHVDKVQYRLSVGDIDTFDKTTGVHSKQRGLRVTGPTEMIVQQTASAVSVHKWRNG